MYATPPTSSPSPPSKTAMVYGIKNSETIVTTNTANNAEDPLASWSMTTQFAYLNILNALLQEEDAINAAALPRLLRTGGGEKGSTPQVLAGVRGLLRSHTRDEVELSELVEDPPCLFWVLASWWEFLPCRIPTLKHHGHPHGALEGGRGWRDMSLYSHQDLCTDVFCIVIGSTIIWPAGGNKSYIIDCV